MKHGNFVITLHTHLPWVLHHGAWPHGSDWLCEAVAECYVPLINVFHELLEEGVTPKVTIGMSPVLCEQLEHPDFTAVFADYCDAKIASAEADRIDFNEKGDLHMAWLAECWLEWWTQRKEEFFHKYGGSVVSALRSLQDQGAIEIITCGATHGYFALLGSDKSINLQLTAARANYKKYFHREPRGMWVPECSYRPSYEWRTLLPVDHLNKPVRRPGVEQLLHRHNLRFFFVDQHVTDRAHPLGVLSADGTYLEPVFSPHYRPVPWYFDGSPLKTFNVSSGYYVQEGTAAIFTRHRDIAMQVWSGDMGYPGDPDYLDFHKKHVPGNHRYWRVTDAKADMAYKQQYNPDWIAKKIDLQSHHFIQSVEGTLAHYHRTTKQQGTLTVCFDTELFGHWWFEGPVFLKAVLKGLARSPYVGLATASEELERRPPAEVVQIPESSWGDGGDHRVWMQPATQWMWQTIYMAEKRFDSIHAAFAASPPPEPARRALTQALRELMLLQSSDWEFLVTTQSARDYAERRFLYHYSDFTRLCDCAVEAAAHGALAPETVEYIAECERRNAVFPELELEWWSSRPEKISEYPPAPAEPQLQPEQEPAPPKKAKRKTKANNDRVS